MAHETPTIEAKKRDRIGTRYARRLRQSGRLPAVIYGHQQAPVPVSISEKEILGILHQGMHVVDMDVDDGERQTCLIKDIQFGYLGDNVVHIDFTRVDLEEEVHVNVSLHFIGEPKGLKETGAYLNHPITELEVICKVNAIPDEIVVDMSDMEATLSVADLTLPPGVRTEVDPETVVAQISYIAEEEVAEGEEIEVGEEAAEPEVISEAKGEEDEEEKSSEES